MISVRREVVEFFKSRGHSERNACALAGLGRSTCRYRHRRQDPAELVTRLRELASERPRFGYRRLHVLLRREGQTAGRMRVYRLYKAAGLTVRRRSRRKLRASRPLPIIVLERPNQRWSMDFVSTTTGYGRTARSGTRRPRPSGALAVGPPMAAIFSLWCRTMPRARTSTPSI